MNTHLMDELILLALDKECKITAYLDDLWAKVNALREPNKGVILQSATGDELDALLPFVLDRAFKGEL